MTMQADDRTARDLEWLRRVAGVDDAYIARWSRAEWDEWSRAMAAPPGGECPSVPVWMRSHMQGWAQDFSLPFPCVAQLWPTAHPWFSEADRHDDLTLVIEGPAEGYSPDLAQVRRAWEYAAARGASPSLAMCIVPGEPVGEAVVGLIEAVYVGGADEDVAAELAQIMDRAAAPIGSVDRPALAWEWMYS